jgi:hypothetical protein
MMNISSRTKLSEFFSRRRVLSIKVASHVSPYSSCFMTFLSILYTTHLSDHVSYILVVLIVINYKSGKQTLVAELLVT